MPCPADSHDRIRVLGARENNLKDVSLEIPKRRLTVFTGVSGSGKTSLVFNTIAAESQRILNETYSAFVQGFLPTLARPDVDVLEGLTTSIIVDQERLGANPRSTVGTVTDANALLRILFSRLGRPHIGSPKAYSFNIASASGAGAITTQRRGQTVKERRTFSVTGGMCPRCEGMGSVSDFDLSALFDPTRSLREGALTIPGYSMDGWYGRIFAGSGFFDMDKPIRDYTKRELADLLHKEPTKIKVEGINLTYEGLIPKIQKSFLSKDVERPSKTCEIAPRPTWCPLSTTRSRVHLLASVRLKTRVRAYSSSASHTARQTSGDNFGRSVTAQIWAIRGGISIGSTAAVGGAAQCRRSSQIEC